MSIGSLLALALIAQPPQLVTPLDAATPPACGAPGQAPDPRCAENLDGRDAPETSTARSAARAALAPPRAVARLVLLPVVDATEAAERHQIFPWLHAITTSDDGKVGVRPEIQYATGFTPSIGARFFDRRLPGDSEVTALFRAGSPQVVRGELALHGPRWLGLSLGTLFDRRDDRLFAGIGNPTPGALPLLESRYRGDIYRAEALWRTPGAGPLSLTLRAGFEGRQYDDTGSVRGGPSIAVVYGASPASCAARGEVFPCTDPAQVPGFDIDRRLLYQRARLALDLRPAGRDRSGVELGLDGGVLHGVGADPSRHARVGFDGVGAIGGGDRLLLLRYVAAVVQPIGGAPVPFDELISPCGATGMRGLPDGLLRDRSGMVGTAEYRWLISSGIDASLFLDEGAVAGAWFAGLAPRDFHTTVGAGLRFYRQIRARYWEDPTGPGLQLAWAPGRDVRLLLTAALF